MLHFTKMHGAANDYVYLNCINDIEIPNNIPDLARRISDRHTGVGGDGLILMLPDVNADCRMQMFNNDGSEGRMCGNGIRCVAKLFHDCVDPSRNPLKIATASGVKTIQIVDDSDNNFLATVDMGEPILRPDLIPVVADGENMIAKEITTRSGHRFKMTAVSMGNPHGVIFVDALDNIDVHAVGRELEVHPMWPDRANIEFVELAKPDGSELRMRVWERGSGETMACGTGACAVAVAANLNHLSPRRVTVHLLGGDLMIELASNGHVLMTGPAETAFTGLYHGA